jgi:hypothetical protein
VEARRRHDVLAGVFAVALAHIGQLGRVEADGFDVAVDHAVLVERERRELDLDRLIDFDPSGIFVGDPNFRFDGLRLPTILEWPQALLNILLLGATLLVHGDAAVAILFGVA